MDAPHIIQRLQQYKYRLFPDGNDVCFSFHGEGQPDHNKIAPLFSELKTHKPEVIRLLRQPEEAMTVMILNARDRIIESHKGRQFRATDETRKAEASIEHLHQEVLNGQSSLAEYQTACERWARLCVSEIERKA
jgi:hypothetical protein